VLSCCGVPASLMQLLYDVWKRSTINHKSIPRRAKCEKFCSKRLNACATWSVWNVSLRKIFLFSGYSWIRFYSVAKWKSEANQMLVFLRIFSLLWKSLREKLFSHHICVFPRNFWHFARRGIRPLDSIFPTKLTEFVPFIFIISQYCPTSFVCPTNWGGCGPLCPPARYAPVNYVLILCTPYSE
jgi:hypothetical protein